jgi:hypothetical protein
VSVLCFLLFLCFRKVTQEIFSELDETKAEVPSYLTRRRSPKESRRRTRGQPHHMVARPRASPRHQGCDHLVHSLTSPFRLFNPLDRKTLGPELFSRKHTASCHHCQREIGRVQILEALPSTLPERGITTGGLLHHHAYLRSDV